MIRLLLHACVLALALPFYLSWSKEESETQIDKMQKAVFNSPGADAPLTPSVVLAGAALIGAHLTLGRKVFALKGWQTLTSFVLGVMAGVALFVYQKDEGKMG